MGTHSPLVCTCTLCASAVQRLQKCSQLGKWIGPWLVIQALIVPMVCGFIGCGWSTSKANRLWLLLFSRPSGHPATDPPTDPRSPVPHSRWDSSQRGTSPTCPASPRVSGVEGSDTDGSLDSGRRMDLGEDSWTKINSLPT